MPRIKWREIQTVHMVIRIPMTKVHEFADINVDNYVIKTKHHILSAIN